MSWAMQAALAALIFAAGGAGGIKWHAGQDAIAARAADEARQSDAKQQRQFGDKAATNHATALATINSKLGDAREKIAKLSGRECLTDDTVRVLNDIGGESVRATVTEPESAGATPAAGTGLRFATEQDVGSAIAICRARYSEVSSQLNRILDIEDRRHPPD